MHISKDRTTKYIFFSGAAVVDKFEIIGYPGLRNVTTREGDSISFYCKTSGRPEADVTIYKEVEEKASVINTGQISYTINNVSCDEAGLFTCLAFNRINTEISKEDLRLFIKCSYLYLI